MAGSCISPAYMKALHKNFKLLYHLAAEKKYGKLNLNGATALKVLSAASKKLSNQHKIKINEIYESILSQLYASAFNYSVMVYHNKLEAFFEDEEPKNTDTMFQIFDEASN